jgi:putative Mn2+ efflux pump MntP
MEHAHELPEWLHIFKEIDILRGMIFGLVHTIIPVIGYYTGWSINRLLKIISNGYVAGLVGVILAHVIADFIAATLDPHLKSAAFGIVLGGLIPLSIIPIMEKYVTKSKYHIVVGDHDDIQKDLKKKHS